MSISKQTGTTKRQQVKQTAAATKPAKKIFKATGLPITIKQKAFADRIIEATKKNGKPISATQAVKEVYDVTTQRSAEVMASENLSNPEIMAYLRKHSDYAENKLVEILDYSSDMGKTFSKEGASYAAVAVSAAKDILDRVHGKATQRTENLTTGVSLVINLTGQEKP